jgi:hypothetical protein
VSKLEAGLDTQIQPMGEGLSNGEKQAICCLRGLLRKLSTMDLNKIRIQKLFFFLTYKWLHK